MRSFARVLAVNVGFDPSAVVTLAVEPTDRSPEVRRQFYPALVEALRADPDVLAAGMGVPARIGRLPDPPLVQAPGRARASDRPT